MPFRRCAHPTCSALVRAGAGAWCPAHAAAQMAKARQYEQQRARDPFRQFYQTEVWRTFRREILAARPTCVDCGRPATDVDHLQTVRGRPDLALTPSNVAPRCHACHARRTSREHSWNRPGQVT